MVLKHEHLIKNEYLPESFIRDYSQYSIRQILDDQSLSFAAKRFLLANLHNMSDKNSIRLINLTPYLNLSKDQIIRYKRIRPEDRILLLKLIFGINIKNAQRLVKAEIDKQEKFEIKKQEGLEKKKKYEQEALLIIRLRKEEQEKIRIERLRRQVRQELLEEEFNNIPENQRIRFIPTDVKEFVWRRDRGRCISCGSQENLEFDHIIPYSKGGSNTARNIQLLCEKCNHKKKDHI